MKTNTILKTGLAFTIGLFFTSSLSAQVKKEEFRIKIIKTENGVNKTIDTTFTNKADFDAFQKTQIRNNNMTMDMLQLEQYKDQLRDGTIEKQVGDSTVISKLKVIRPEIDESEKQKVYDAIYNAKDGEELLKVLNINIDSIVGTSDKKIKLVNIYSRMEIVDAPLSIIKSNKHPQMQQAAKEEKLTLKSVNVYPNPSSGIVFLDIETLAPGNVDVLVTDIQGREIFKDNFFAESNTTMQRNINIDGHKTGIYLLKITSQGKSIVKKLIFE